MPRPFFPDPILAWAFYLALVGLTAAAAVVDWRTAFVPKRLTLAILASGVLANLVRGAWMGAQGEPLWMLATGNAGLGALDGFLLALLGFLTAFGLFFVLWVLGTCGGGDVKLFAALGAWVGPLLFFFLFVGSTAILMVLFFFRLLRAGPAPSQVHAVLKSSRPGQNPAKPSKRRMTFSLPVAVTCALVLLWVFRADLGLAESRPVQASEAAPTWQLAGREQ